jgi:hypothetical protein
MNMSRKVEVNCIRRGWLESLRKTKLRTLKRAIAVGHDGMISNERADHLPDVGSICKSIFKL